MKQLPSSPVPCLYFYNYREFVPQATIFDGKIIYQNQFLLIFFSFWCRTPELFTYVSLSALLLRWFNLNANL